MNDTPPLVSFVIPGTPRPQGSLKIITNPTTGQPFAKNSDTTTEHRNRVIVTMRQVWDRPPLTCPVAVRCLFTFPRPKSHFGTGKNRDQLRPSAPIRWHGNKVDLDKLARLIGDALTIAGVIADDSQISLLRGEKTWGVTGESLVEVWGLDGN